LIKSTVCNKKEERNNNLIPLFFHPFLPWICIMLKGTKGYRIVAEWLDSKGFHPLRLAVRNRRHLLTNKSGLVNAPSGCGKKFPVFLVP
jgi:hypothetical protein